MDTTYIREECRKMNKRLVAWRRHFHRIPEIGVDLPETEAAVRGFRGVFSGIGASNPDKGIHSLHHSPVFDIDESVLWQGRRGFLPDCIALAPKCGIISAAGSPSRQAC